MSNPYAGGPGEPSQVRGGLVAVGVVLGIVATFIWMVIVFVVALSQENNSGGIPDWLVFVLFFLPLPLSILLLVFRRTRQAAAGFVMGLAIGVLVLAGLCSGLVVLPGLGAQPVYPTLGDLLGTSLPVGTHGFFVLLGVLAAGLVFVHEARRRGQTDERILYVVMGALVGGAVFMRLGTWLQHVDLRQNASFAEQWLYGNRSILGGLVGAWLGVHVAKRTTGYRARTGDLFAPAVAIGMAIGRIGCLLTEQPGTPTGGGWGITLDEAAAARTGSPAGVPLHPSFVYEIAFHLAAFAVIWWWLRRRSLPPGESFVWYVAGYAVFRFLVEFVRGNDVAWAGLTRPQLFLILTIPLVLARIVWQVRHGAYRGAMRVSTSSTGVAQGTHV